jgi:uncharacterized tellurite resistance protein B-like protein
MHILVGIASALGLIAYFIIRANQVNRAGRDLLDAASEAKGFVRRSLWRRRTEVDPTRNVEDPRLAAAVMMCAVANADGEITEREMTEILGLMERHFQMARGDCEVMLAEARWMAKETKDLSAFLQRLSRPVSGCCSRQELEDLFDMLETVDRVEGDGSAIVDDALANLQRRLMAA